MQRFGQAGLALLSYESFGLSSTAVVQVLLLRRVSFAPQELSSETAPSLTSSFVSGIAHGSGNITLPLTGLNFLLGVAVTWNGSYCTTSIVNSTRVTVAIPATDLAISGSASF